MQTTGDYRRSMLLIPTKERNDLSIISSISDFRDSNNVGHWLLIYIIAAVIPDLVSLNA